MAIAETLLLQSLEFPELNSTTLQNKVAAMKRAFEAANQIFEGRWPFFLPGGGNADHHSALKTPNNPRNSPVLEDVLRFVHRKQALSPYTSGAIVMKVRDIHLHRA